MKKINILGGGPAGLYAAACIRRELPEVDVTVYEQNDAETTFGFGVVFSDTALGFLSQQDPETLAAITEGLEKWSDIELRIHGDRIRIDGVGFTAIARLRLLDVLRRRAVASGAKVLNGVVVGSLADLEEADLLIGADGVNSLVRRTYAEQFGSSVSYLKNWFAWFGATRPFDFLTQTFKSTEDGSFNAHHYRYAPSMSTFLVEVDQATFERVGFANMSEDASRDYCERVFADALGTARLVTNKSIWRQFPIIANERWTAGNCVLVGDALRTAHFSIGSGTRLALEDVQYLAAALGRHPRNVGDALLDFESVRRPVVEKLTAAATRSAEWYDHFHEHMRLPAWDFAMNYMGRSGRIDMDRLRAMSPQFVAAYDAHRSQVS